MQTKEISINAETVNYIEGIHYELSARKDIIAFMLSNDMKTDTEAFQQYQKELSEFYAKFNLAKKELESMYIPPEWKGHEVNWTLDYVTGVMTIQKLCKCAEDGNE